MLNASGGGVFFFAQMSEFRAFLFLVEGQEKNDVNILLVNALI
jgi:hypothetical protein